MSSVFPGDCLDVLPSIETNGINLIATTPSEAERRNAYLTRAG